VTKSRLESEFCIEGDEEGWDEKWNHLWEVTTEEG